ncbi:MAG: hypothetical protein BWK76_27680 [Desulfobulbaceae bacterium A2]|nr:MAG: hypothetical protein BWK76_27680 [Desulfobulbaceae bacterium A2]
MTKNYPHITRRCFVNAPLEQLEAGLLDTFLRHDLQPEIGLEWNELASFSREQGVRISTALRDRGLACTLHAPFFDLAPGAGDPDILAATRAKLGRAFDLLPVFQPRAVVCHLGYDDKQHRGRQEQWLRNSLATWWELLGRAAALAIPVHFENTYEYGPEHHVRLLTALGMDNAGFCLDVGHALAFGREPLDIWIEALHPWLRQLHLHDNDGTWDEHRAIGSGKVDFQLLLQELERYALQPIVTLEPHSELDLWGSLAALDKPEYGSLLNEIPRTVPPPSLVTPGACPCRR